MNKLKNWLYKFMYGRYGADTMYWWLFGACLVLLVFRSIFAAFGLNIVASIVNILSTAAIVYAMFRFFSKNRYKRSAENRAFCQLLGKIKGKFTLIRDRFRDRKTHVYKSCPKCGAVLRLPRQKGEHTVRCPKCGDRFDVKI